VSDKSLFVRIGDFFFKYRNVIFPVAIFANLLAIPPGNSYFGVEAYDVWIDWIGVAVVCAGLVLRGAIIGFAYIKRGGLDKKVHADDLVTEGFFAAGRKPLYVGNMLIYTGIFLMQGGWPALIGPLVFFAIYSAIIAAEEHFLRNKFGAAFEAYCATTPRWGIRLSVLRKVLPGMHYDWRRVVAKDYTTFANAILAMVLVSLMEVLHHGTRAGVVDALPIFIGAFLAIGLAVLAIRLLKKRTDLLRT
jgi:protein-S-isoprenylcysteine O-methyltransferase Ste14